MKLKLATGILLTFLLQQFILGQAETYSVTLAPFSSKDYDEFSPVYYEGGIVFCSNQRDNSLVSFKDEQNRLFNIVYATKKNDRGWKPAKILAKEMVTDFNDGPVTFSENGNIIYYSRNNSISGFLKNITDSSNKLGIYSAVLVNGTWTNIKPFTYNSRRYSLSTPALASDGKRIYFSSDMPGGSGGKDLYYCERLNNGWDLPVNLGPVINTPKNESFPFACKSGKLFFTSDGHPGFGGKDLFYTEEINGDWIFPVHLDSAINSTADDFGLVTDSTFENGYFSTNRRKTDDIFSFSSAEIEFTSCDKLKENNYCFTFYDEQNQLIDTINLTYLWDFGDGMIRTGPEVKHCFPGPGTYVVKLKIIDELTGKAMDKQVDYKVELEAHQQAYINSYNLGIVNESISFNAVKTKLPGFRITDYLWNFGDGFKPGGPYMSRTFRRRGEYTVQLGLIANEDSTGKILKTCVMKKIRIYNTYQELALRDEAEEDEVNEKTDVFATHNRKMQTRIYLIEGLPEQQKVLIKDELRGYGKMAVRFDRYGIKSDSYPFLDKVAGVLKENPELRLEIAVHASVDDLPDETVEISEKWAQELAFYFRNKEIDMDESRSKGFGLSNPIFESFVPGNQAVDVLIEFVFLKQ